MPWQSLVENLESIRIAGQILFAMDMAARKKREFGRWRAVGSLAVLWRAAGGVARERAAASEVAAAGRRQQNTVAPADGAAPPAWPPATSTITEESARVPWVGSNHREV